tara:strand:+ start:41974 stop:43965 length:1992 start_codon:yes stop_codon:yes gene_type:complete
MSMTASDQIKVGLVQVNNSFSGQNYLPYSVACLQSYAQANASEPSRLEFLEPIYKRMAITQIVERLIGTDIAGFSTYVWNINISLEVARRLKAISPNTLIAFGGPQVPDHAESFLREHPQVDLTFHGEGERSFTALLDAFPDGDRTSIAGTSFIDADGTFVNNPAGPRLRELGEIPSPFLNGVFNELIENNPHETWIGLWETNRGCPFKCTYCDWGSAVAAKVTKFDIERLYHEADWFSDNKIEYIFVCDANFGMLSRDIDIVKRVAENRKKTGYPQGFSVQNTKNATDRAYVTQKLLSDAGLNKGVALSIQSLSSEALLNIKRDNISLETYLDLQQRFANDKVETYSDIILGLPGETYTSFVEGIEQLLESGQHNRIQYNNCSILPNAEMAKPDYRAKFKLETVENEIVNIHGSKELLDDDVPERQELIIATYSLPREDWKRSRAFAWMSALLHFNKILQIPIILLHQAAGVSYRTIFDHFMDVDDPKYPMLTEIRNFFLDEAERIQQGGTEYTHAPEWLNIYWPADEYIFIKMTAEETRSRFYDEARAMLMDIANDAGANQPILEAIEEAVMLNEALLHRPFVHDDLTIELRFNIMEFYKGVLQGETVKLTKMPASILIERSRRPYNNFQTWCQEIVWWGNKKGAYLYTNSATNKELAGHF